MRVCGVIEGFYGPPWSHAERLEMIDFCGRAGFNLWVHAPKDDPWHRARWRDPYPEPELERLGTLVTAARRRGLEFAYAVAPGLDVCYSAPEEFEALRGKLEQVRSVGVERFQLLWDDVEHALHCGADRARYRSAPSPTGAAQGPFSTRMAREIEQSGSLVVCPMDYAGTEDRPYRRSLRAQLDSEIVLYWTGPEVVSHEIDRASLELSVERYGGHPHLLWDNYPVNDWAPAILHLGPLRGRDPQLADTSLLGIVSNGMLQAIPSKLALATVADWARDPVGYEPVASFARALHAHGAEVLDALRHLTARSEGSAAEVAALAGIAPATPPPRPAAPVAPDDVAELAAALAPGVGAADALRLLEPFV